MHRSSRRRRHRVKNSAPLSLRDRAGAGDGKVERPTRRRVRSRQIYPISRTSLWTRAETHAPNARWRGGCGRPRSADSGRAITCTPNAALRGTDPSAERHIWSASRRSRDPIRAPAATRRQRARLNITLGWKVNASSRPVAKGSTICPRSRLGCRHYAMVCASLARYQSACDWHADDTARSCRVGSAREPAIQVASKCG